MATAPRVPFQAVKPLVGLSIATESFSESLTQTFKAGAPCVIAASGYLTECGADPVLVMGIAQGDGHNTAAVGQASTQLCLAHPCTLFMGNLDNGSGTAITAVTDRGKSYGIAKDATSGKWYIDKLDTTAKRVIVWGFWDGVQDGVQAAVGDTIGWTYFTFGGAFSQGFLVV
jgi:hypothetical protein